MTLEKTIEKLMKELDAKEKRQDAVLQLSREAIRDCARAIRHLHTGQHKECLATVKHLDEKMKTLHEFDEDFSHISQTAYQEYSEIKCLLAILDKKELPDFKDLGIDWQTYLSGLADCVGELRRSLQLALKNDDYNTAEYLFEKMNYVYDNLMQLKYSGSLVGPLKRKQDMIRGQVEQARSEMLRKK